MPKVPTPLPSKVQSRTCVAVGGVIVAAVDFGIGEVGDQRRGHAGHQTS